MTERIRQPLVTFWSRSRVALLAAFGLAGIAACHPPAPEELQVTKGALATPTFVQVRASDTLTSASTVTTPTLGLQTAGSLNVVAIGWNNSTSSVQTVTDSKNNQYFPIFVTPTRLTGTASQTMYYAKNIAPATANTNAVTVIFNSAVPFPDVRVAEYRNIDTVAPLDQSRPNSGTTGTSTSSGQVTTTFPTELVVAANYVAETTMTAGTGFTSRIITPNDKDILEDRNLTPAGNVTATANVSPSGWWIMQVATFRALDNTVPGTTMGLAATVVSSSQIDLTWTAATDDIGVTGYSVERCLGASCSNFVEVGTPTATSFSNTGLTAATSYRFRVRAKDATGNFGAFSTIVSATTSCTSNAQCGSGFCANGVCCNTACTNQCFACNLPGFIGTCSAKSNGTTCDDGNLCTQTDTCQAGTCTGSNPKTCTALDQCHVAGTCAPATGVCSNPNATNGTTCSDGDLCTQTDTCQAGVCTGANPKTCTALDQCHVVGTCAPGTGVCSNPNATNGTTCNDGNLCTQTDTCQAGTCTGGNPKTCTALDQCHVVGTCAPGTGVCSNPNSTDGTTCNDGNLCTQTDACQAGTCTGGNPKTCTALDQCHLAGTCAPVTGICSNPAKTDGSTCSDGNACTQTDTCVAGSCTGANPKNCSASDQCHLAGTCDTVTGACSNPIANDNTLCTDSDACTVGDRCRAGACEPGTNVACPSDDCHTAGTCNPTTGLCSTLTSVPDHTPCDDRNSCTLHSECIKGTCLPEDPVTGCTAPNAPYYAPLTNLSSKQGLSLALDINNSGQVTGVDAHFTFQREFSNGGGQSGFVWTAGGGLKSVPQPVGIDLSPNAISPSGVVVGSGWDNATNGYRSFRYDSASDTTDLLPPVITGAMAINSTAQFTGVGVPLGYQTYQAQGSTVNWIPSPSGSRGIVGWSIDEARSITGYYLRADLTRVAFRYIDAHGTIELLNRFVPAGGDWDPDPENGRDYLTVGYGVSRDGTKVVGTGRTGNGLTRGFVMTLGPDNVPGSGTIKKIDLSSGASSAFWVIPRRINQAGEVVGSLNGDGGETASKAFIWVDGTGTFDLQQLVDPASGWVVRGAFGINDPRPGGPGESNKRDVVGWGMLNGQQRAFKMTVPDLSPCTPIDSCHLAGIRDRRTGQCSTPAAANGTTCDDGNACTRTDQCVAGVCTGTPLVCPGDFCQGAGTCNPSTGLCDGAAPAHEGQSCDDGNVCTLSAFCKGGSCVPEEPAAGCTNSGATYYVPVVNLGSAEGASYAVGINENGVVTGADVRTTYARAGAGGPTPSVGFRWTPTEGRVLLPQPSNVSVYPRGINLRGTVAGMAWDRGANYSRVFRFNAETDSQLQYMAVPTGNGTGINDNDQVTGSGYFVGVSGSVMFRALGSTVDIIQPLSGAIGTQANAIDSFGGLVGYMIRSNGTTAALRYSNAGGLEFLNQLVPGGSDWDLDPIVSGDFLSTSNGVNDRSQIVGSGRTGNGLTRGFVMTLGPDGTPGSANIQQIPMMAKFPNDLNRTVSARGINSRGEVVGTITDSSGIHDLTAFIWVEGTGIVDLNDLIDPASGWVLSGAYAINDHREVVGLGWINGVPQVTGQERAFKMTVPDLSPCPAVDSCHGPGIRDLRTGQCSSPILADGTGCNDGDACTPTDTCTAGVCGGALEPSCAVVPIADGLATVNGQNYAVFSYDAKAPRNTYVPYGQDNHLSVGGVALDAPAVPPPAWFLPGLHRGAFTTPIDGSSLSWTVGARTVTVDASTPLTPVDVPSGTAVIVGGETIMLIANAPIGLENGLVPPDQTGLRTAGVTNGSFAVDASGRATYHIPLDVPPGRAGLQPALGVGYSSGSSDDSGPLGLGWSLQGLSRIARCSANIARDGATEPVQFGGAFSASAPNSGGDRFCMDGEVLLEKGRTPTEVSFVPERTPAIHVTAHVASQFAEPEYFEVFWTDGRVSRYDALKTIYRVKYQASTADEAEPGNVLPITGPKPAYQWLLTNVRDEGGNQMAVRYESRVFDVPSSGETLHANEVRPAAIDYTFTTDVSEARRSIVFNYDDRPDPVDVFVSGYMLRSASRLRSIEISGPDNLGQKSILRTYFLDYERLALTGQTALVGFQECAGDAAHRTSDICKAASTFRWEEGSELYDDATISLPAQVGFIFKRLIPADIDGDGDDDFIIHAATNMNDYYVIYVNDGAGHFHQAGTIQGLPALPDSIASDEAVFDANGDGVLDFAYRKDSTHWNISSLTRTATGDVVETVLSSEVVPGDVRRHYIGDFNGDGWSDVLRPSTGQANTPWQLQLGGETSLGAPIPTASFATEYPDTAYVVKALGGARTSLLMAFRDSIFSTRMFEMPFDPTGHVIASVVVPPTLLQFDARTKPFHYLFADLNGDGLTDALKIQNDGSSCRLVRNSGNGFGISNPCGNVAHFPPAGQAAAGIGGDPGLRIGDLNDDGRADVVFLGSVAGQPWVTYIPGSGTFDLAQVRKPDAFRVESVCSNPQDPSTCQDKFPIERLFIPAVPGSTLSQLGDFNGDGRTDFVVAEFDGTLKVFTHAGKRPGVMTDIIDGYGVTTTVDYQPVVGGVESLHSQAVYTRGASCGSPQQCLTRGMWVVGGYTTDNGIGGKRRFGLRYGDGRSDPAGRGWLGFGTVTLEDQAAGTIIKTVRDNSTVVSSSITGAPSSVQRRVFPLSGLALHLTKTVDIDNVHERGEATDTVYSFANQPIVPGDEPPANPPIVPGEPLAIRPQRIRELFTEYPKGLPTSPTAVVMRLTEKVVSWDQFDHVVDSTTYTSLANRNFATGPRTTFHADPGQHQNAFNLPDTVTITSTDERGKVSVRKVAYEYYAGKTLVKRRTIEPDGPAALKLVEDYDPYDHGRVTRVTRTGSVRATPTGLVPDVRTTSLTYDPNQDDVFPVAITVGHQPPTKIGYITALGVVGRIEDPNGAATTSHYDVFGRYHGFEEEGSDAGESVTYLAPSGSVGSSQVTTTQAGGVQTVAILDALGREIFRRETGFNGPLVQRDIGYDALGRVTRISNAVSPPIDSPVGTGTVLTWDRLGRLRSRELPDHSISHVDYDGLLSTMTNESGVTRRSTIDALGRLFITSEDGPTGAHVDSRYQYGPFDRLEKIIPESDPTHGIEFDYDGWNRKTSITTADAAPQTIEYNPFGEVVRQIDPKYTKTISYDELGRVRTSTTTGLLSEGSTFEYDRAGNGVGKPWRSTSGDGVSTEFSYDDMGRPRSTTWAVASLGQSFSIDSVYDSFGRVSGVVYPSVGGSRFTTSYEFDARGVPKVVHNSADLSSFYWKMLDRFDDQLPHEETWGDLSFSSYFLDDNRRLRSISSDTPDIALQRMDLEYRADGNLLSRTDYLLGVIDSFTYDTMDRLATWSGGPIPGVSGEPWTYKYVYSDSGNLLSRTALTANHAQPDVTFTYGERGAGIHAVTSSTLGALYDYDRDGNQTSAPGRTVDYNSLGLPLSIATTSGESQFGYDARGSRVFSVGPSGHVVTLGDLYERRASWDGSVLHTFRIPGAERMVAEVSLLEQGGTVQQRPTRYLHYDQVGSVESVSFAGAPPEFLRYAPYGGRLSRSTPSQSGPPPISGEIFGFTDQMHDDAFGLINMRGRIYDPTSGRFLSPDPFLSSLAASSTNPYAYVSNNPLRYVDPSGFAAECIGPAEDPSCAHVNDPDWWNRRNARSDARNDRSGNYRPDASAHVGQYTNWDCYLNGCGTGPGMWDGLIGAAMPGIVSGTSDDQSSRTVVADRLNGASGGPFGGSRTDAPRYGFNSPTREPSPVGDFVSDNITFLNNQIEFLNFTLWSVMEAGFYVFATVETGSGAGVPQPVIVSRINMSPKLVRAAEEAGKSVQNSLNVLVNKLAQGNLNPGIGTRPIGQGFSEARARDGARVYFRIVEGVVEILGKSNKANQASVIEEVLNVFGRKP